MPKMNGRYGGYWRNLQYAINLAKNEWAIFIEDDMQFIRCLERDDYKYFDSFFKKFKNVGYLGIEFFKESNKDNDLLYTIIDKENDCYFFQDEAINYRGTLHCNNIGIINIKKMRIVNFELGNEEQEHRDNAKRLFDKMRYYPYPLSMFLPFSSTTKNRKKTFTRILVEKYYRTGFYPYQEMSKEELDRFLKRDISILPYTSDWLKTAVPSPGPPFEYADSMKRANKWFRRLEKIENYIFRR
jgi:hypothetical protein